MEYPTITDIMEFIHSNTSRLPLKKADLNELRDIHDEVNYDELLIYCSDYISWQKLSLNDKLECLQENGFIIVTKEQALDTSALIPRIPDSLDLNDELFIITYKVVNLDESFILRSAYDDQVTYTPGTWTYSLNGCDYTSRKASYGINSTSFNHASSMFSDYTAIICLAVPIQDCMYLSDDDLIRSPSVYTRQVISYNHKILQDRLNNYNWTQRNVKKTSKATNSSQELSNSYVQFIQYMSWLINTLNGTTTELPILQEIHDYLALDKLPTFDLPVLVLTDCKLSNVVIVDVIKQLLNYCKLLETNDQKKVVCKLLYKFLMNCQDFLSDQQFLNAIINKAQEFTKELKCNEQDREYFNKCYIILNELRTVQLIESEKNFESVQSVKTVESIKNDGSVQPVEPVEPIEPIEPVEPVELMLQ